MTLKLVARDGSDSVSTQDLIAQRSLFRQPGATPLSKEATKQQEDAEVGFFEGIGLNMTETIPGQMGRAVLFNREMYLADKEGERDLFYPEDEITDEFLAKHPAIIPYVKSGYVYDISTRSQFYSFVGLVTEDENRRRDLAQTGLGQALIGNVIGEVPTLFVGRAFGAGDKAMKAYRWARNGNRAGQLAKLSGLGAASNTAYEFMLQNIDPTDEADAQSLMTAAFFGGVMGPLIPAGGKVFRELDGLGRHVPHNFLPKSVQRQINARAARSFVPERMPQEVGDAIKNDINMLNAMLESPVESAPLRLSVLKHPDTDPLVKQLREKYADAGHKLEIGDHPQQGDLDALMGLDEIDAQMAGVDANKLPKTLSGIFTQLVADGIGPMTPSGKHGRTAYVETMRFVHRTLFTDFFPSKENFARGEQAEGLANGVIELRNKAAMALHDTYRSHFTNGGKAFSVTLSDGSRVTVGRRFNARQFSVVVRDYMTQLRQLREGVRNELSDEFPDAIKEAGEHWSKYTRSMLDEGERAGRMRGPRALEQARRDVGVAEAELKRLDADDATPPGDVYAARERLIRAKDEADDIQRMVDNAEDYVTRRWLTDQIRRDQDGFTGRLVKNWQRNRTKVPIHERPIIVDALDRVDSDTREAILGLKDRLLGFTDPTEQNIKELGDDLWAKYDNAVDDYFAATAETTTKRLAGVNAAHGIDNPFSAGNPLKGRVLDIDESEFRDFMDNDLLRILDHYNHQMAGAIGVGKAVAANADQYLDLVNRNLKNKDGKPYTLSEIQESIGKGEEDDLILAALGEEANKLNNAAGRVDRRLGTDLQTGVNRNSKLAMRAITSRYSEMLGQPITGSDAGNAGWRAIGRSAMRIPFITLGGGFMLSSIPDAATLAMMESKPAGWYKSVGNTIGDFHGLSRWALEAIEATANEASTSRSLAIMDVDNMPIDPRLQDSMFGRIAARVDQATDVLARQANVLNGMNYWNRNWRRLHAHGLLYDTFKGMQAVNKLTPDFDRIVAGGNKKAITKALRDAGFKNIEQLRRLERMGFTREKSQKLLSRIREHGTDIDGNPLKNLTDEEFANWNRVYSPEFEKWHKSDPELYDFFVTTIDNELRAMIAEPTLGSRPLMNNHMVGRMVNQFWSFAIAWGNQTLPAAQQMPTQRFGAFLSSLVGIGAMVDAAKAHLSGQRSFEETSELWQESPFSMMQNAVDRSGMLSWIARPTELLKRHGISLGTLAGEQTVESTSHSARAMNFGTAVLGPTFDTANKMFDLASKGLSAVSGQRDITVRDVHTARTMIPYQNNIWLRLLYRATHDMGIENPFGPGHGIDLLMTQPHIDQTRAPRQPAP